MFLYFRFIRKFLTCPINVFSRGVYHKEEQVMVLCQDLHAGVCDASCTK